MGVKFDDYTIQVMGVMDDKINAVLEECAGEVESQTKRNQDKFNKTGQTSGSWQHHVDDSSHIAVIGSNFENAIWEEFGTGEYALHGNGRKGGWIYVDEKGDGHFTHGKKPRRHFWNAYTALKSKIVNHIQNSLKGL